MLKSLHLKQHVKYLNQRKIILALKLVELVGAGKLKIYPMDLLHL